MSMSAPASLKRKSKEARSRNGELSGADSPPPAPEAIRAARESIGLTQAQAAALIGSIQMTWARYETGTRPMPARLWHYWLHIAGIQRIPFRKLAVRPPRKNPR